MHSLRKDFRRLVLDRFQGLDAQFLFQIPGDRVVGDVAQVAAQDCFQRREKVAVGPQFLQEQPRVEGDQAAEDLVQPDLEGRRTRP